MATVQPYLNFPGTTEEAFTFYQSVFGGEFQAMQRFKDTPEGDKLSEEEQEMIMHVALPIGPHTLLMATDALPSMGFTLTPGNNFSLTLITESKEEAERLFSALSAGGQVTMPLADAFWGDYFGMLTDPYGIQWMISYDYNQKA
ncbi:VOC family protein [Rhabdobacter roseus]|uniref:PhnB protein n=1 Tax=Rhabdobacter roseus TaxID=1655419 RepID=A0A840TU74_9BACT|nr:VOC family protein [Rhabdobacter roseus]MBB5287501.1 PhnB protein [Rhabdobacter roseus]